MTRKLLTQKEVDAIDPTCIDSVTAERLIECATVLRRQFKTYSRMAHNSSVEKAALWLASQQGELSEAAQWIRDGADDWIGDEVISDLWAHDWRAYWAYWGNQYGDAIEHRMCDICGRPATISNKDWSACSERHRKAILGQLPDQDCRLCDERRPCAHDLAGSPVCADCFPGDRLLAEARAGWASRWDNA